MISNPINPFINGSESIPFTYEGGTKLFHFCPRKNGSTNYSENVIFFANDLEHAQDVFKRMIEHLFECSKSYKTFKNTPDEYLNSVRGDELNNCKLLLEKIKNQELILEEAPVNQFYKVGWAGNDTVSFYIS